MLQKLLVCDKSVVIQITWRNVFEIIINRQAAGVKKVNANKDDLFNDAQRHLVVKKPYLVLLEELDFTA